jgi:hypothetical protein
MHRALAIAILFTAALPLFAATPAQVVVTNTPGLIISVMLQPPGQGTFTLTNVGETATTITLGQQGTFFTQSPTSFALAGGASQIVTVTAGSATIRFDPYEGASLPIGNGVAAGMRIPIKILFIGFNFIIGEDEITPGQPRVEVTAPAGTNPSGTAVFRNRGDANSAFVTSDSPWLLPDSKVTFGDDASANVNFTIDRSRRPDQGAAGSVAGSMSLFYQTQTGFKGGYKSYITVVDTVQLAAVAGPIPPLGTGEVALFVSGAGNVTGSGGKTFLSDVSILNATSSAAPSLRLYYLGGGVSLAAPAMTLSAVQSLSLADIVKSMFGRSGETGVVQFRGIDPKNVFINANVFNSNNPAGSYGTAIPVFRSDRAAAQDETLFITGVRRDSQSHTNLFLQEVSGQPATVDVVLLGADGSTLRSILGQPVGAFAMAPIYDVAPAGAVAVRITNRGNGKIAAYATPLDEASGDNWALVDWNKQNALSGSEPMLIPVAGAAPGANSTYFRTDVAISNSGTSTATALLRYFTSTGSTSDQPVTLQQVGATQVFPDIVTNTFHVAAPTLGYIVVTPTTGLIEVTSRTYTTVANDVRTYGTAVPTVALSSGLTMGQSKLFGGLDDSTLEAVNNATPGTFRTNFGFVETSGNAAIVRVTVQFFNGRQLSTAVAQGSRDYTLNPNELRLVPGLLSSVLGDSRETTFGEMHNVQAKFEVVSGSGRVVPFITTADNGSGDTVYRGE